MKTKMCKGRGRCSVVTIEIVTMETNIWHVTMEMILWFKWRRIYGFVTMEAKMWFYNPGDVNVKKTYPLQTAYNSFLRR